MCQSREVPAPSPPRDSQRSRVYRAETPLGGRKFATLPDCATYVDRVVGSLWWYWRFPESGLGCVPRLRPGNGARQAFYKEDPEPSITLPRRYRTSGVMLHELAHWALRTTEDLPNHGTSFTRLLLDLVAAFEGDATAKRLGKRYESEDVHVGRPARLGPDGRWSYTWDERLRKGRGRCLRIGYGDGQHAVGVLVSRAHAHATLSANGSGPVRIPEREIWSVEPV
jgi:putative metallohydrolase (TIGR04338 family)